MRKKLLRESKPLVMESNTAAELYQDKNCVDPDINQPQSKIPVPSTSGIMSTSSPPEVQAFEADALHYLNELKKMMTTQDDASFLSYLQQAPSTSMEDLELSNNDVSRSSSQCDTETDLKNQNLRKREKRLELGSKESNVSKVLYSQKFSGMPYANETSDNISYEDQSEMPAFGGVNELDDHLISCGESPSNACATGRMSPSVPLRVTSEDDAGTAIAMLITQGRESSKLLGLNTSKMDSKVIKEKKLRDEAPSGTQSQVDTRAMETHPASFAKYMESEGDDLQLMTKTTNNDDDVQVLLEYFPRLQRRAKHIRNSLTAENANLMMECHKLFSESSHYSHRQIAKLLEQEITKMKLIASPNFSRKILARNNQLPDTSNFPDVINVKKEVLEDSEDSVCAIQDDVGTAVVKVKEEIVEDLEDNMYYVQDGVSVANVRVKKEIVDDPDALVRSKIVVESEPGSFSRGGCTLPPQNLRQRGINSLASLDVDPKSCERYISPVHAKLPYSEEQISPYGVAVPTKDFPNPRSYKPSIRKRETIAKVCMSVYDPEEHMQFDKQPSEKKLNSSRSHSVVVHCEEAEEVSSKQKGQAEKLPCSSGFANKGFERPFNVLDDTITICDSGNEDVLSIHADSLADLESDTEPHEEGQWTIGKQPEHLLVAMDSTQTKTNSAVQDESQNMVMSEVSFKVTSLDCRGHNDATNAEKLDAQSSEASKNEPADKSSSKSLKRIKLSPPYEANDVMRQDSLDGTRKLQDETKGFEIPAAQQEQTVSPQPLSDTQKESLDILKRNIISLDQNKDVVMKKHLKIPASKSAPLDTGKIDITKAIQDEAEYFSDNKETKDQLKVKKKVNNQVVSGLSSAGNGDTSCNKMTTCPQSKEILGEATCQNERKALTGPFVDVSKGYQNPFIHSESMELLSENKSDLNKNHSIQGEVNIDNMNQDQGKAINYWQCLNHVSVDKDKELQNQGTPVFSREPINQSQSTINVSDMKSVQKENYMSSAAVQSEGTTEHHHSRQKLNINQGRRRTNTWNPRNASIRNMENNYMASAEGNSLGSQQPTRTTDDYLSLEETAFSSDAILQKQRNSWIADRNTNLFTYPERKQVNNHTRSTSCFVSFRRYAPDAFFWRKEFKQFPRPDFPSESNYCPSYVSQGKCSRHECLLNHKMTSELEIYLGLLILHHATHYKEYLAWSILRTHTENSEGSATLPAILLMPFARSIINKNPLLTATKAPDDLRIYLDIAKMRALCENQHGEDAYRLLCLSTPYAPQSCMQELVGVFVRYCENIEEEAAVSPWEKVLLWGFESPVSGIGEKYPMKDILDVAWWKYHLAETDITMVAVVYHHLCKSLKSPNRLFKFITRSIITFLTDRGEKKKSFLTLEHLQKLGVRDPSIYESLIPSSEELLIGLAPELKELSQVVCDLQVPLPFHMWDDLVHLFTLKQNFALAVTLVACATEVVGYRPKKEDVKALLLGCCRGGPTLLPSLSQLVLALNPETLGQVYTTLNNVVTLLVLAPPPAHDVVTDVVNHCKENGITFKPKIETNVNKNHNPGLLSDNDFDDADMNHQQNCDRSVLKGPSLNFVEDTYQSGYGCSFSQSGDLTGLPAKITNQGKCVCSQSGNAIVNCHDQQGNRPIRKDLYSSTSCQKRSVLDNDGPINPDCIVSVMRKDQARNLRVSNPLSDYPEWPRNARMNLQGSSSKTSHGIDMKTSHSCGTHTAERPHHLPNHFRTVQNTEDNVPPKFHLQNGYSENRSFAEELSHSSSYDDDSREECTFSGAQDQRILERYQVHSTVTPGSLREHCDNSLSSCIRHAKRKLPEYRCTRTAVEGRCQQQNSSLRSSMVPVRGIEGVTNVSPDLIIDVNGGPSSPMFSSCALFKEQGVNKGGVYTSQNGDHIDGSSVCRLTDSSVLSLVLELRAIARLENEEQMKARLLTVFHVLSYDETINTVGKTMAAVMEVMKSGSSDESGVSRSEREVVCQLGVSLMVECNERHLVKEAATLITALHQYRSNFYSYTPLNKEPPPSEQRMAILTLEILYRCHNFQLFTRLLDEIYWSGGYEDLKGRLQVLSRVLHTLLTPRGTASSSSSTNISAETLDYTTKILASLVKYYQHDCQVLSITYTTILDLPGMLTRAWQAAQACSEKAVVFQLRGVIVLALHTGVPLPQEMDAAVLSWEDNSLAHHHDFKVGDSSTPEVNESYDSFSQLLSRSPWRGKISERLHETESTQRAQRMPDQGLEGRIECNVPGIREVNYYYSDISRRLNPKIDRAKAYEVISDCSVSLQPRGFTRECDDARVYLGSSQDHSNVLDDYRGSYQRTYSTHPEMSVFMGTTEEDSTEAFHNFRTKRAKSKSKRRNPLKGSQRPLMRIMSREATQYSHYYSR